MVAQSHGQWPLTILAANFSQTLLKAFAVSVFGFLELLMETSLQADKLGGEEGLRLSYQLKKKKLFIGYHDWDDCDDFD